MTMTTELSWLDVPAESPPDPATFRVHWDPIGRTRMAPLKALMASAHPRHVAAQALFEAYGTARNRCDAAGLEQALVELERLAAGDADGLAW